MAHYLCRNVHHAYGLPITFNFQDTETEILVGMASAEEVD